MNHDKLDQRIVEMSFENEKFEKGISQSQNSLKEFARVLKNSDIDRSFSGLDKSVKSISDSFSVFEQIAVGGLRRIGESAVMAGAQMVKSLTFGQVADGFNEYELKMNTIRAVMNATGKSAVEVRESLGVLDDYADKTIFNTKDMFDNLSKFTNSGIELSKSTKAMIGVANATAYAGQDAMAASYAYNNFADAISNGFMSLTDWRSISRVAKIATQEFRGEILKTAVSLGTLNQAQIDSGEVTTNFEDTLKDQWLTADVVTEVLNKYGDATTEVGRKAWEAAQEVRTFSGMMQSLKASIGTGFANTFELMFGDLEEAKKNFTYINQILTTIFTSGIRNANGMLAAVKELGGVSNVFQGIKNTAISFLMILKPIANAFDQIFPPKTKEQWVDITKAFKDFTAGLMITDSTGNKIRRTFAGLFAVVDIGWQVTKFLGQAVFDLAKAFFPLGDGILGTSASLGDLLVNINKAIKSSQVFQYGIVAIKVGAALLRDQLSKTIAVVKDFVIGLWNAEDPFEYIKNTGKNLFSGVIDGIKMVTTWISDRFTKAVRGTFKFFGKDFNDTVVGVWPTILSVLKEVVKFIGGEATDGFKSFGEAIKNLDFNKIATFVVGGVILMFIKQLSDLTASMAGFTNSLSKAVNSFTKSFLTLPQAGTIKELSLAIGVLAASLWVLSTIPEDDLVRSFLGLAAAITTFVIAYALIQTINVASHNLMKDKELVTSAFGLTGVAAALLIMAAAVKVISKIDRTQVWNSVGVLGAMVVLITAYQALTAVISKIPGQQKVSMNLLGMSFAVTSLIGSLVLLNFLTKTELESSLTKLATIMLVVGALEGVFAFTAKIGRGKRLAVNIAQLGVGIVAMVATIKLLTFLDKGTILQSIENLALMTAVISGIELTMGLVGRLSGGKKVQSNILAIELGLAAMIGLVAIVGLMKTTTLDQGITNLSKMAAVITGIQLFTALSARIAGGNKVQGILGSVSFTLLAFTGIIAILGNMESEMLNQGIGTISKMIGLVGAVIVMTGVISRITWDARMFSSLIGVTLSIVALTGSLALLSIIDQDSLRKAVVSMVVAASAIGILSFSIQQVTSSVNMMSKGTKNFKTNAKNMAATMVGLGIILGATAAFFGIMGNQLPTIKTITPKDMAVFTIGFAAISGVFMALDHVGKQMITSQFDKQLEGYLSNFLAIGAILGATGLMFGEIGLLLPIIKSIEAKDFAIFLAGLGSMTALLGVIGTMGIQLTKTQFDKQLKGFLANFTAIGAILGATGILFASIGLVLPIIKNIEAKDFVIFLTGLGSMTALLGVIGKLGVQLTKTQFDKQLSGYLSNFLAVGAILGATGLMFATIGMLLPTIKDIEAKDFAIFLTGVAGITAIIGGIAVLGKAFEALGQGGGAVIKGVGVAIIAMVAVVAAVALLAEALNLLINSEAGAGLTRGLDLLVEIGAGIGRFVGAVIGGVGGGVLESIGTSIANFATSMNGVSFSKDSLDAILALSGAVVAITGASIVEGLNRFLGLGTSSMETFGQQLSGMISAIKLISVKDAETASSILAAMGPMVTNLKSFAEVAKTIPNSGGWWGGLVGENDIDKFGTDLALFVGVFSYITATQATHMTEVLAAMRPMVDNLKLFAGAAQNIPNSGGFIEEFMGGNDINVFGKKLTQLIAAFIAFTPQAAAYAGSVLAAMTPMASNLNTFAETSKGIPNSGGWIGGIVGDNTIDEFGNKLASLIGIFGTVDTSQLSFAISNLQTMNNMMLPNLKTFVSFADSVTAYQGFDLVAFASDVRGFVGKLAETDFTVVAPAMAAMNDVTESFQTMGSVVLENAKKSFENNKEPFQTAIVSILQESIILLNGQKEEIIVKFTGIFSSVIARIDSYVQTFKNLGVNVINGFIDGIEKRRPTAVQSIQGVMAAVITGAQIALDSHSPSRVFKSIGGWCTIGLAHGIKAETDVAVRAGENMAKATEEGVRNVLGVHSESKPWYLIGNWLPTSLGNGVTGGTPNAVSAVQNLGNQIMSTGKSALQNRMDTLVDLGKKYNVDMSTLTATGVTESVKGAIGGASSTLDTLLNILQNPTNAIAAAQGGSAIGNAFGKGAKNIGETTKKVKTEIEKLKEALDDLNFYGNSSLEEELVKYQELRKKYTEGSDDDKAIDREVYTRLKTIYDAQITYINNIKKAKENAAKEVADLETKYNKDFAAEQASAEAEKAKARIEYANQQKAINDKLVSDIAAQNRAYEDAVASRSDTIASSFGLFDNVDLGARASGDRLLKNLQKQNEAFTTWKNLLDGLKSRGVSDSLIKELQDMGPSANAQLKALLSLTDEQLTEYDNLFERKYSFATDKATEELVGLRTSTQQNIEGLRKDADVELRALSTQFSQTMYQINFDSNARLTELATTYHESLGTVNTTLTTDLTTMKTQFDTTMKTIRGQTEAELVGLIADNKKQLEQLNKESGAKLGEVKTTFGASASSIVSSFGTSLKDIVPATSTAIDSLKTSLKPSFDAVIPEFVTAGLNAAQGFAKGIYDGVYMATNAAAYLAQTAVTTAKKILDENSPSEVFKGIGKFVSMGFAKGIQDYAYQAEKASEEMARGPIAAVSKALAEVEDRGDYSFTITPVIDLSAIRSTDLSRMINVPVNLGGASSKLASETVQNGIRLKQPASTTDGSSAATTTQTQPANINFVQNNYSPTALSRLDIYRQTKNQLSAMKGLVGV